MNILDDDVCYCGHVADEHERNNFGQLAECTVPDCNCIMFERDEEEDDES